MTLPAKDIDRLDDQRACEETLATARALSDAAPADLDLLRDLSAAYSDLGDVLRERGAADAAIGMFEQHLAIARSVSERVPDDLDAMNELCAAYERVADVAREQGDLTRSLEMARRSLDLSRELVERAGDEPRFQRGLAIACEKVANVLGKHRAHEALTLTEQGLAIRLRLCERDPNNTLWKEDLSVAYERLAELSPMIGEHARARESVLRCIGIRTELCEREPDNMRWLGALSIAYVHTAWLLDARGESKEAAEMLEKSLQLQLQVVQREPKNLQARHELACGYHRAAERHLTRGSQDKARALAASELGLEIVETLVGRQASNVEWRFTLASSLYLAARSCDVGVASQRERAKALIDRAEEILVPLPEQLRARLASDIEDARAWRKKLALP